MNMKNGNTILCLVSSIGLMLFSSIAWAQADNESDAGNAASTPPTGNADEGFTYIVLFLLLIGFFFAVRTIRNALTSSTWSLADALSEQTTITLLNDDGTPVLDASKEPVEIQRLVASSSRMIAFMGTIVILLLFIGFGTFSIFRVATTGIMPESTDSVVNFLVAGLTLFAPYVVNNFSDAFKAIPKGK